MSAEGKRSLGDHGEELAASLLKEAGYTPIKPMRTNHPFWDILATDPSGEKHAISVKTRNKFTIQGTLNSNYHLFKTKQHFSDLSNMSNYLGFKFRWLSIQVDVKNKTYTAHLGNLNDIGAKTNVRTVIGIRMTENGAAKGKCLALNRYDDKITPAMSNARTTKK